MKRNLTLSSKAWSLVITAMMMLASQSVLAQYVKLTALQGTKINQGEGVEYLVDRKAGTKWGQSFDPTNPASECWVILKAATPVVPVNYFLITGNDTGSFTDRNWFDWTIYAANFDSDAEATADAEGWVVIDEHENGGLPAANSRGMNFKCSKSDGTTAYQYFFIRVTDNDKHGDVWTQMDEFGFGTYEGFLEYLDANTDDPVVYTIIAGDRNNNDGEGLKSLFDGNYGTKWGNGLTERNEGEHSNGAYFIIKTSRAMAPTYYKLVTGTDNASWHHRNWKQWQIYGIADVPDGKNPGRWDEGWVALDKKYNVSESVLPDKNSFEVFFELSEENTAKYRFFKVEIDKIMSGGGYMQMTEFSLGDQYTFLLDRAALVKNATATVDVTKPFYAGVKNAYADLLNKLENTADIFAANQVKAQLDALQGTASASVAAYETYMGVVANVRNHYENHDCMDGNPAGKALIGKYLNENVAPDATFQNGSYPYIIANCQLDNEGIDQEGKYINSLLESYATDLRDGAIDGVTFTALSSNKFDGNEGAQMLVDGNYGPDAHTKWGFNGPGWIVFKCDDGPIAPTYYTLVVANDTDGNKGRQWKTWKIYGGNFDSDEAAERNASGWVLIDEKKNIGHDEFPTTNHSQTTFNMTNGGGSYQYFRIEVESNYGGGQDYTQMAEILFFNYANFLDERDMMSEEYAYLLEDHTKPYYIQLKNDYLAALKNLHMSTNGAEMKGYITKMTNLLKDIESSENAYEAYETMYADVEGSIDDGFFAPLTNGTTAAWAAQYFTEKVAPNKLLRNGSHEYIMTEMNVSTNDINDETEYLYNMWRARDLDMSGETTGFVYLGGHVVGQWGDGHPKHLVDNIIDDPNPNYDPGVNPLTKLGGNIDTSGDTYVIFKTMEKYNPYFYTLVTGADTYLYQDRNPGSWTIYGANFEGDAEATKDAEGWVVVDEKVNIGKDRMLPQNLTASYFGFSTETTEPYQYYKIVIWGNFEGKSGAVQLQELQFGTVDQFEEIKDKYIADANDFDLDVLADIELVDGYSALVDEYDECVNMEVLYRVNHRVEQQQALIQASVKAYGEYEAKVLDARDFLAQNLDKNAKGYTELNNYLNVSVKPEEDALYPNGSAKYILENMSVRDSVLTDEAALLETLIRAYLVNAYVAGADISQLIINADFSAPGTTVKDEAGTTLGKEYEGWEGLAGGNGTNSDGVSALEFVRETEVFDFSQTLKGLKNGYYAFTINAAFRPNANDYTSYNHSGMLYANDVMAYIPVAREGMIAVEDIVDGVNCVVSDSKPIQDEESQDTIGYVVWGIPSCCAAFGAGRYENTLVAEVTDGTLTIGVKNDGTVVGGDWTGIGNARLVYLGADLSSAKAKAAVDAALACAAERATVMTTLYVPGEGTDDDVRRAPNYSTAQQAVLEKVIAGASDAAGKMALLKENTAAVQAIYAEKHAYASAYVASSKVYDKWAEHAYKDDSFSIVFEEDIFALREALTEGSMNAEEALAKGDELMAKYPDLLQITASNAVYDELAPFSYELAMNGKTPYINMNGLYGKLDEDRIVLSFEYMSETPLVGGFIRFGMPTPDSDHQIDLEELPASPNDWTKVYYYINVPRTDWKWGTSSSHTIAYTPAATSTEGQLMSLRNMYVMTVKQALAEGGTITRVEEAPAAAPVAVQGIYNIMGQRVSRAVKGLYIINGKKVLVK